MTDALSISAIFMLAGFVQGLTGFGSALVAMPLLCLFLDVKSAVPLSILCSLMITTTLAIQLRRSVSLDKIWPLCVSSIPGIALGVCLLKSVDSSTIRFLLGLLLVVYSIYNLTYAPQPQRLHRFWAWVAGFCSGAIGAAFSAGGPPAIIYTTLNNWSKDEIKATMTGFFLFNSSLIASVHGISGVSSSRELYYFCVAAPFILAGVYGGSLLYRFVPGENYKRLVFIFIAIMGLIMMAG